MVLMVVSSPVGGGDSNMKVTYKCLPENESRVCRKKGVIRCGHQKNGVFLVWTPKNGGHSACKKCNFKAKICKFYVKIAVKLFNFSKCMQSMQKLQLYGM